MSVIDLALYREQAKSLRCSQVIRHLPSWNCVTCPWSGQLAEGSLIVRKTENPAKPGTDCGATSRRACPRCGDYLTTRPRTAKRGVSTTNGRTNPSRP